MFQFNEENGVICQYFHSGNWNEINPTKRNQAKRMETLHWWLPLGLRQRRSRWFIKRDNYFRPTIKFTAEISENQITFLDTTEFRPITSLNQFTHFASCHPPGINHGFIKGEAIRLLRTNSPKEILEACLLKFKQHLKTGGWEGRKHHRKVSIRGQLCLYAIGSYSCTKAKRPQRTTRQLKI